MGSMLLEDSSLIASGLFLILFSGFGVMAFYLFLLRFLMTAPADELLLSLLDFFEALSDDDFLGDTDLATFRSLLRC